MSLTQRPTANVLTGLIKANIPSRVCLKVASAMESRIILDRTGGEHLQGKGDLLFLSNGSFDPIRLQACYVSTTEMRNVGIDLTPKADTNTKKADGFLKRLFKK